MKALALACMLVAAGCASEPSNGCLLAAINRRAVLRARAYMRRDVETHLLAVWFSDSRHVALIVRGDHRWFAWDDAFGGRPLFHTDATRMPGALDAARAAFPQKTVELAWWAD